MALKRIPTMAMVIVACLSLFGPTLVRAQTDAGLSPDPAQPAFTQAQALLDQLEQRHPHEQAALFKLREAVVALHDLATKNAPVPAYARSRNGARAGADEELGDDLYSSCEGLQNEQLKTALRGVCANQVPVGYQGAQALVFETLDNKDGWVECVYTGRRLQTAGEPNASNMNIEHTWPQSQGAVGDAKSDLHHLFPTDSKTNGLRSSYPFGWVKNPTWEQAGCKFDGNTFEPRDCHKGNVARAIFYFATRYNKRVDAKQEAALREWNKLDPVDAGEKTRCNMIENAQHNRNPFVDHPEFVDAIADF